ncbi:hypothetical protein CEXT_158431 [Caerostris extrusa]|uniref:Uncharacterized protein n=1 Tax=Caerostris extrusa TaxID=172846 RepID=A0AAV4WZF1_CAEEX|nr:hypothetical protein CEXT_158431 [Caerostris extrusa]
MLPTDAHAAQQSTQFQEKRNFPLGSFDSRSELSTSEKPSQQLSLYLAVFHYQANSHSANECGVFKGGVHKGREDKSRRPLFTIFFRLPPPPSLIDEKTASASYLLKRRKSPESSTELGKEEKLHRFPDTGRKGNLSPSPFRCINTGKATRNKSKPVGGDMRESLYSPPPLVRNAGYSRRTRFPIGGDGLRTLLIGYEGSSIYDPVFFLSLPSRRKAYYSRERQELDRGGDSSSCEGEKQKKGGRLGRRSG